jgi:nicotinamide mononucleotide transporter
MNEVEPAGPTVAPAAVLPYETPPARAEPVGGWFLALLTVATAALAAALYGRGNASILEAIAFVTGAVCVWLTVRESVWNFPIGLLNVAAFAVVFFRAKLFGDAGLQIVYFGLTAVGWYWWLYGGERRTTLRISRTPRLEMALILVAAAVLTPGLWFVLTKLGGSTTFWDALTTALSLCAQWLLNRKRLENWFFWIAADLIYVPLYAYKSLYLSSILYTAFLAMCVIGVIQWRATWRAQRAAEAAA